MPNLPFWPFGSDDEAANDSDGAQLDACLDAAAAGMPGDVSTHEAGVAGLADVSGVAEILRSAAATAEPAELAGESAAIAAFRKRNFGGGVSTLSTRLTRRAAACLAAGAVTLTGAATAAYACVLPAPIQSFAHHTIAAPAPDGARLTGVDAGKHAHRASPTPTRSAATSRSSSASPGSSHHSASDSPRPTASGLSKQVQELRQLAAYGLCRDYAAATKAGTNLDSGELAALARLAGGATVITSYCAKIPVPPQPACVAGPHATLDPSSGISTPGNGWRSWCDCSPAQTSRAETKADGNPHALCDAIMAAPDNDGHHPGNGAKPLRPSTAASPAAPLQQKSGPAGQPQHPSHGPFPWVNGHGFGIGSAGKAHQHPGAVTAGSAAAGSPAAGSPAAGSPAAGSAGAGSSHVHSTG
ncbi:MAG: hypothetical protein ACRDV3_12170 [Acidothermaceae bacterium]